MWASVENPNGLIAIILKVPEPNGAATTRLPKHDIASAVTKRLPRGGGDHADIGSIPGTCI